MEEKVLVEIFGHKARIESVTGFVADKPWWPEDRIQVWLCLDKPVGSTAAFGVNLPVRSYTKDEFLAAVQRECEYRLIVAMEEDCNKRELRERKKERQEALDRRAEEIGALIGMEGD